MTDVNEYMQFMEIASFPEFEEEYYEINDSQGHCCISKAVFDVQSRRHKLMLPSNILLPKFLLFHELTHVLDAEIYTNGDRNHDFCLTGYMEYHAAQIELMVMMGAKSVSDNVSFSMEDVIDGSEWHVRQYVDNKLEIAKALIESSDQQERITGLGALYNFLGLKSICAMCANDYVEVYNYQEIQKKMSFFLLFELRQFMNGWVEDLDKAINLYSHAYKAVIE